MNNRLAELPRTALKGTGILVTSRPQDYVRTRRQSFHDGLQGLRDAWQSQQNLSVQICVGLCVIASGIWVRLSTLEWLWVAFAIGLVMFAELMNTAIEHTVNLVVGLRPDPLARRAKDVSASCVLVASILAVVIGALTFLPHLLRR